MKQNYSVSIEQFEKLNTLPESWGPEGCRALLDELEFAEVGSIAEAELRTYAVMALQDLEPEEAARIVLRQMAGEYLTPGQIQNLAEEMKDDRKWEDASDMRCHEPIFNAQDLLSEAFPQAYAVPDIVRLLVRIAPLNQAAAALLKVPLTEPLLVRILADGMPPAAVLRRLFDDALAEGPFPEASQILWQYTTELTTTAECRVILYAPDSWMGPLEHGGNYESTAFPDPPLRAPVGTPAA